MVYVKMNVLTSGVKVVHCFVFCVLLHRNWWWHVFGSVVAFAGIQWGTVCRKPIAYTSSMNSSDVGRKLWLSNSHHSNESLPALIDVHIKADPHSCQSLWCFIKRILSSYSVKSTFLDTLRTVIVKLNHYD